jgi:hypothetical protein
VMDDGNLRHVLRVGHPQVHTHLTASLPIGV